MLEIHNVIIKFLVQTILETEIKAIDCGREIDFAIIPETFDDDYYGMLLESDGCDIHFKVYYEIEGTDCFVTVDFEDGLHESVYVKFTFSNWVDDFQIFSTVMKVVLERYIIGNWTEAMAEMQAIGLAGFVKKYQDKKIIWQDGYLDYE
ncbi:TPA: hypothetical protein ACGO05_001895 [Streptococcus suis]